MSVAVDSLAKVEKLKKIIRKNKGKFFTVVFTKADGTERKMNCRTGVKKYLVQDSNKPYVDPMKIGNVVVFEHGTGYRTFKLERVKQIKIGGQVIDWDQI
jgi:hypothetical protein